MSQSLLAPLYRVDQFLRMELVQTLTRGGTLDPNKDWSVITNCYSQTLRQRGSFSNELWTIVEAAFENLTRNLNSIADLLREIAIAKASPSFDESPYLNKANALIERTQKDFTESLSAANTLLPRVGTAPASLPSTMVGLAHELAGADLPTSVKPEALALPQPSFDRFIWWCKNSRVLLPVLLIGGAVILAGNVVDSLDKLIRFYKTYAGSADKAVTTQTSVRQSKITAGDPNLPPAKQ
ncbi:MAG: hypothetical protein ACREYF_12070 [Gammaproteobacteria bacterium]